MTSSKFLSGLDPFLAFLIASVVAASLLPAQGMGATIAGWAADLAIALLFFLHGAKLSRAAIAAGIGNWRLHWLVLASSFLLFPMLGFLISRTAGSFVGPEIVTGFLYLSLLPSTVQSSIAFTAMAGGDVPAAVCSASLSNIVGIFLTPVLVGLTIHVEGATGGISGEAIRGIALQLLLPFTLGHLARPLIGSFIAGHKTILMPIDRGSILLVVYTAFSAAVMNGIWKKTDPTDLVVILILSFILLTLVMAANLLVARRARLVREEEIVLLFCGSKKSLVSGVPMAAALFPAAQVGFIILPLMIFHQVQLFACAVIAQRYRSTDGAEMSLATSSAS